MCSSTFTPSRCVTADRSAANARASESSSMQPLLWKRGFRTASSSNTAVLSARPADTPDKRRHGGNSSSANAEAPVAKQERTSRLRERRAGQEREAGPQRGGEEVYPAGAEDAEAKTRSSFSSRNWPFSATCCIKSHLNLRAAGCRFLLSRQTLQPCKHTQARSGENRWNRRNKRAQTDSLIGGGGQTKASDIGAGAEGLYGSII